MWSSIDQSQLQGSWLTLTELWMTNIAESCGVVCGYLCYLLQFVYLFLFYYWTFTLFSLRLHIGMMTLIFNQMELDNILIVSIQSEFWPKILPDS